MNSTYLTRSEYSQARTLASDALLAFNTGNRDSLSLIASTALDNRQGAKQYDRDASVVATWSTLAHMAATMSRGNTERSSDVRNAFHSSLEGAKSLSRAA